MIISTDIYYEYTGLYKKKIFLHSQNVHIFDIFSENLSPIQ